MGYKYIGDGNIGISLNVQAPKPLDIRSVVNSTKDLYEINPKYAYEGMTVANLADGNIYMLIDIKNIDKKAGWRASYESLQIISCTAAEYDLWLKNTNIDGDIFSPIDETIDFIHYNTYYYVDEDTGAIDENGNLVVDSQEYYITKSWIEEALKSKTNDSVTKTLSSNLEELATKVGEDVKNLEDNYSTTKTIEDNYLSKTHIEENYYTKDAVYTQDESNSIFVTRNELKGGINGDTGEGTEGGTDDFVFVTQTQYTKENTDRAAELEAYKTSVSNEFSKCVKIDSEAQLKSVSTEYIKNEGKDVIIQASSVKLNELALLTESDVDKHVMVTLDEYNNGPKNEDTYYYITEEKIEDGWVLNSTLQNYYTRQKALEIFYTKEEVNTLLADLKQEILNSIQS